MTYRAAQIAFVIPIVAVSLSYTETAAARPEFEVASIKRDPSCDNRTGRGGGGRQFSTGRLNMECTTLQNLVQLAYGTFADGVDLNQPKLRISGGPDWIQSEFYDLAAKAEGAARVEQMMGPMLRTLLEDRFKLKIHRESKETPVYALTVAKSGLKLHRVKDGSCVPIDLNRLPQPREPGQPTPDFCGNTSMSVKGQNMIMNGHGVTIRQICQVLSNRLDRRAVDKTGIAGLFDFHLEFSVDEANGLLGRAGAGDSGDPALAGPSILDALQEQLGLKLMPDKSPVEFLVIDHVEKPSDN